MKIKQNVFWGSLCIIGAISLVINKLGYLQEMGFWSILFSVILLGIFIKGAIVRSWGTILFSAAFFVIVNDKLLHLENLTPWTVLGVACLGTIGLRMLFPMKHKRVSKKRLNGCKDISTWEEKNELMITEDGEVVQQDVVFGNSAKYVKSKELCGINADCVFGEISIYLTEAELKNHRAKVNVDVVFGNAHIYIPAGWTVSTNMDTVFGGVSFCGTGTNDGEDKLLICGDVVFGELVVHYV